MWLGKSMWLKSHQQIQSINTFFFFRYDLQVKCMAGLPRLHSEHFCVKQDWRVAFHFLCGERGRYRDHPPFFCSQLRVPPHGESERKTVSKGKCGYESEPGYDGFSLCHTPASAFMPPSESLGRGGQGVDGAIWCVWECRAAQSDWSWEFCGIHSSQECRGTGAHQSQRCGAIRV